MKSRRDFLKTAVALPSAIMGATFGSGRISASQGVGGMEVLDVVPEVFPLKVDTFNREAVTRFFQLYFPAFWGVPMGWTGNPSTGDPGTISPRYMDAALLSANFYRAFAGVPTDRRLDPDLNRRAQAAAFRWSMLGDLSVRLIDPALYTDDEIKGSRWSNRVSTGFPLANYAFVEDQGISFHRHRWSALDPASFSCGIGATTDWKRDRILGVGAFMDWFPAKGRLFAPWQLKHGFVAWPAPGFNAREMTPREWSFSFYTRPDFSNVDFNSSTVRLKHGRSVITPTILYRQKYEGMGWRIPEDLYAELFNQGGAVSVEINGVRDNQGKSHNFQYQVEGIDTGVLDGSLWGKVRPGFRPVADIESVKLNRDKGSIEIVVVAPYGSQVFIQRSKEANQLGSGEDLGSFVAKGPRTLVKIPCADSSSPPRGFYKAEIR